jgi:hypothetical protein
MKLYMDKTQQYQFCVANPYTFVFHWYAILEFPVEMDLKQSVYRGTSVSF